MPRPWTRDELLLVLHLYERIPFGQQDQRNAQVILLARRLERTPGSVAMKLNNMTSLDPDERSRGIVGLSGASRLDRKVWTEFHAQPRVIEDSEELWETRVEPRPEPSPPAVREGPTEAVASRRVRLGQQYFARLVLTNFQQRCALTGIAHRDLLTASHISPWSDDPANRLNAANGLCLNKLHDAAFDRKLIAFDDDLRMLVSEKLRSTIGDDDVARALLSYEGRPLRQPVRRPISMELLRNHRAAFQSA